MRPPQTKTRTLVPLAKVAAWLNSGAPIELVDDLAFGVWVPTVSYVSHNKRCNYSSITDHLSATLHELNILEREDKIEVVPPEEVCNTIFSPLGAVPRKDPNRVRLIHDLSLFVNDSVPISKVSCPTIDDVLPWVTPNSWIWKRDWKGGYAQFFIEPSCRRLLGFQHPDGRMMRYKVLTMGANNSAPDFCRFSYHVRDILRQEDRKVWAYVDDSFGVHNSQAGATEDFVRCKEVLSNLMIDEAKDKACPPAQVQEILGFEVDTINMVVRVPEDKISTLIELCVKFKTLRFAPLKEVQSFVGKLTWAAKVVKGGRIFLSRMYHLLFLEGIPTRKIFLSREFHSDVLWWLRFLRKWNGISLIGKLEEAYAATDAAKFGFGAWTGDQFLFGAWASNEIPEHSNWKELRTVLLAVSTWGELWRGKRVTIGCDNMPSVAICKRGYSRSPKLAKLMRQLFWLSTSYDIDLNLTHIAGVSNNFADFLSRQFLSPHPQSCKQRVMFVSGKQGVPAHAALT